MANIKYYLAGIILISVAVIIATFPEILIAIGSQ